MEASCWSLSPLRMRQRSWSMVFRMPGPPELHFPRSPRLCPAPFVSCFCCECRHIMSSFPPCRGLALFLVMAYFIWLAHLIKDTSSQNKKCCFFHVQPSLYWGTYESKNNEEMKPDMEYHPIIWMFGYIWYEFCIIRSWIFKKLPIFWNINRIWGPSYTLQGGHLVWASNCY